MLNKLTISSLLILSSTVFVASKAIAQEQPSETRIEKYENLTQSDTDTSDNKQEDMKEMEMEDGAMEDGAMEDGAMEPDTRTEETMMESQSNDNQSSYDVRRTEAFNLVSSAYRGDFEKQGINSYAVFESDYENGNLTAEDLVAAAVDAGDLSPGASEDDNYIQAVDSQLQALVAQ